MDLVPNEDADANIIVTELSDWVKQSEQVQLRVDEVMAGNKLDAVLCVAGGWAGGNAKSKSMLLYSWFLMIFGSRRWQLAVS